MVLNMVFSVGAGGGILLMGLFVVVLGIGIMLGRGASAYSKPRSKTRKHGDLY